MGLWKDVLIIDLFCSRATSLTVDAAAGAAASTVPVRCEVTQTTSVAEEGSLQATPEGEEVSTEASQLS